MVVASRRLWLLLGLGVLTGGLAGSAHAQIPPGYEVVRITEEAGSYQPPAINARGQVVFSQRIDNDFDREEIFLWTPDPHGDGGTLTQITDDNVRDAFPDINDYGTIVWSRRVGPDRTFEIAMWREGEITILTDNALNDSGPRVNNVDHVVWNRFTNRGCSESEILFFDGERTRRITDDGFSNQGGMINDRNELVWTRYNFCVNPWQAEMMLYSEGKTAQLTTGGGQIQIPDINNETVVVWGGEFGIERWLDGKREVVADSGFVPRINDAGMLTFSRWHPEDDAWQVWWYDTKDFYQLTDTPSWDHTSQISAFGEVAWVSGPLAPGHIRVMRIIDDPRDLDVDGDTDLEDFALLQACFNPMPPPSEDCVLADLNDSGAVDEEDFRLFSLVVTGPE